MLRVVSTQAAESPEPGLRAVRLFHIGGHRPATQTPLPSRLDRNDQADDSGLRITLQTRRGRNRQPCPKALRIVVEGAARLLAAATRALGTRARRSHRNTRAERWLRLGAATSAEGCCPALCRCPLLTYGRVTFASVGAVIWLDTQKRRVFFSTVSFKPVGDRFSHCWRPAVRAPTRLESARQRLCLD